MCCQPLILCFLSVLSGWYVLYASYVLLSFDSMLYEGFCHEYNYYIQLCDVNLWLHFVFVALSRAYVLLFLIVFIVNYSIIYAWITNKRMISMGMISMPRECMNGAVLNHQRYPGWPYVKPLTLPSCSTLLFVNLCMCVFVNM
jgi:hypothetical protein